MTDIVGVMLITVALLAGACSGDSDEPSAEARGTPPAGDRVARAEEDGEPAPAAGGADHADQAQPPAELQGEPLEVVVKESHLRSSIPTDDETVVHAAVADGVLEVHVENLEADCGPVPELEARLASGRAVLRLVAVDDGHCVGRQEIKLRMELPRRTGVETVELRGPDGQEIATVDVSS